MTSHSNWAKFVTFHFLHRHRSKHNSSGSSSIAVLHNDGESNLEGYLFDVDSRSSSISLNSMGSHQDSNPVNVSTTDGMAEYTNGNISSLFINQDSNSSIEVLQETPNLHNNYSPLPKRYVLCAYRFLIR